METPSNPLSNSTSLPEIASASSCQYFSRASLFGFFLTLQFSQLTQPYGSLLFRGVGGWLWRMNPISSFVEGLMIAWQLYKACARVFKRRGPQEEEALPPAEQSTREPATPGSALSGHVARLMKWFKIQRSRFMESALVVELHATAAVVLLLRAGTEGGSEESPVAKLKEGTEDPGLIKEAFGSNALYRHEFRIDLVTWSAVALIFLRLFALQGAYSFRGAAWALVSGWVSVQLLLVLAHCGQLEEIELRTASELARRIDTDLTRTYATWKWLYISCHLLFFGYGSSLAMSRAISPLISSYYWPIFLTVIHTICVLPVFMGKSLLWDLCGEGAILVFLLSNAGILFSLMWNFGSPGSSSEDTTRPFPLHSLHEHGYRNLLTGIWVFHIAMAFGRLFSTYLFKSDRSNDKNNNNFRRRISHGNALMTAGVFAFYICVYDERQVTKRGWYDWLG